MGSRGEAARALQEFDELAGLRDTGGGGGGGGGSAGGPVYTLEHLATFTVTRETGIVYPADGMRRLLQLEKTNGIWSQKMQLCVEGPWVLVMDYETGSVMERFPGGWVHSPTAFTSPEPGELYNNVLAFVVGPPGGERDGGDSPGGRRELHIFQCHDVSAHTLVEELSALKGGSGGGVGGGEFAIERERERDGEHETPHRRQAMMAALSRDRDRDRDRERERDDASSTGSERMYEQDIAILNRCFDDIEKFIARLQHAAAAMRELERRRRGGGAGGAGRRGAGDGLLAMRTRPPHEREFTDVLQKFKLSFNLLARLRAHIHDPNAPELVHFLFTPLALIVDAAQDVSGGGGPGLPSRVVQPLLTRDALNLLANCVTSKETELWHSLGEAWLVPRESWKSPVPPYQPVFTDGWTPDYLVDDQPLRRSSPRRSGGGGGGAGSTSVGVEERDGRYERDLYTDQYQPYSREGGGASGASSPEREPQPAYRPRTPDEESEGESWAVGVMARGGRVVRVTYPRTANNDKELSVVRGEYLEVLDDSRKWWKARNRRGVVAHVPHTIVAPAPLHADTYPNPLYAHHPERGGGAGGGSAGSSPTQGAAPPPPPPLPPPPTPAAPITDTIKSNKSAAGAGARGSSGGDGGDLHAELAAVLPALTRRRLDIKKTPDIYIHQKSTPEEVGEWLEAKGFSMTAQRQYALPGHRVFAVSRAELERVLGTDEGRRLYSQLLVQRNVSGFKTTSASELQSILRRAREKIDTNRAPAHSHV